MKKSGKLIAASILFGATRVSVKDDVERTKRIAIAQLYHRLRLARKSTRIIAEGNPNSPFVDSCRAAEAEAWNSLQAMKNILWSDRG